MLGIRLDAELERRLEMLARDAGRSKSDLAREALRRYVAEHDLTAAAREQSLRAVAAGSASADCLDVDERGWTP